MTNNFPTPRYPVREFVHNCTLQTFGELEQEIPGHLICRMHKSYMVAIDNIESLKTEVIKLEKKYVPISGV